MIALYFDPAQARDGHGRWSTLVGSQYIQQASDAAWSLAAHHSPLRTAAPLGQRAAHRATYHAAMAQRFLNLRALGQTVADSTIDHHLSELGRTINSLRARRWQGRAARAVFDHYRSMELGLRAARKTGTGVHVAHHFGEALDESPVRAPSAPAPNVPRPQDDPTIPPELHGTPEELDRHVLGLRASAQHAATPQARQSVTHAADGLDALRSARVARDQGDHGGAARHAAIAEAHLAQYSPDHDPFPQMTDLSVKMARAATSDVPGVLHPAHDGLPHTNGVVLGPAELTPDDIEYYGMNARRALSFSGTPEHRANYEQLVNGLNSVEDAHSALDAGKPDEAGRLYRVAGGHFARFDPALVDEDERDTYVQLRDSARNGLGHALLSHTALPAHITAMRDQIQASSTPEPRMVSYGHQREAFTGRGFDDAHKHEIVGELDTPERQGDVQAATGCSTYSEFRRRMLSDDPLIDHDQTSCIFTITHGQDQVASMSFYATLKDKDGKKLGSLRRTADAVSGEVHNDYFELEPSVQGGGMSSRVYQSQEEAWKAAGYTHITVQANISVGAYAWATHGYDYNPKYHFGDPVQRHRDLVQAHVDALHRDGKIPLDVAVQHRTLLRHCQHPWDFARFTVDHPGLSADERLVGKAALVGSATWYARKELSDDHKGNRVSNATRRSKGLTDKT